MRCQHSSVRGTIALVACAIGTSIAGCQTLDTEMAGFLGDERSTSVAENSTPPPINGPHILVEMRENGRKPSMVQLPLNEPTYVQQAIEQSGVKKRFRRMKIELYRQLPNGGGHKIPVAYDRGERQVPPGSDYFLHPNDRLVITEDTSNTVDDVLNAVAGPMSEMIHQ